MPYVPVLLRDRPRHLQIILGGVIPAIFGAVAGILIGVSAGAYYAWGAVAAIGGFIAGFEHRDGWGEPTAASSAASSTASRCW